MHNHIEHLTLSTGHLRSSPRSEVDPSVVDMLCPLVAASGGEIPSSDGCAVRIMRVPGGAVFTVDTPSPLPDIPRAPLVTCWLSIDGQSNGLLWRNAEQLYFQLTEKAGGAMLHFGAELPDHPKSAPWLATLMLPGLAFAPQAAAWLGDFERCLAWAIIDDEEAGP